MKIKHRIMLLLSIVLICCAGTVCAADSNNTMDMVCDVDSNEEFISINKYEQADDVDESVLSAKYDNLSANDVLKDDDGFEDDDDDDEDYVLDEDDINEYIDDIKSSTSDEYFKFFTYLIKQKGFKFDVDSADSDEGYILHSSQKFDIKLYGGNKHTVNVGDTYFIHIGGRSSYVLDNYYPDIIYQQNGNDCVDELYLGWLKWDEQYKLALDLVELNSDNMGDFISTTDYSTPLPKKFDLRNVDGNCYVTPVKNQGSGDDRQNCWAFASIAALESYLLKSEGKSYELSNNLDFSENNLKNALSSMGEYGTDFKVNKGGNAMMALAYFIRWSGPILDSQDRYISNNTIEYYKALKHVQGVKFIPARNGSNDTNEIKRAIMDYGGVVTSLYWNSNPLFEKDENYYCYGKPNPGTTWHEVCIIGWDDNYDRTKFAKTAPGNGAFIVKNSYGSAKGDNGYSYVSYYDESLARFNRTLGIFGGFSFTSVQNNTNYGRNYHYTPLGVNYWLPTGVKSLKYRSQWIAYCDETLKACGIYVNNASKCIVDVFIDGNIVSTTNVILNNAGFHTITLDTPVKITNGKVFMIQVTQISSNNILLALECPIENYSSKATANIGESEIYNETNWIDISCQGINICLNAYTEYTPLVSTKITASDLTITLGDTKDINARLTDSKGNVLRNAKLVFTINGKSQVVTTDSNGEAKVNSNIIKSVGTYDVKIEYFGSELYDYTIKKIKLNINKPQPQKVDITFKNAEIKSNIKISLKSGSDELKGERINIQIGKKNYKNKKLNKNGEYTVSKKLTKNPATVKVTYKGNDKYKEASKIGYIYKLITVNVDGKTFKVGQKITLVLNNMKKLNVKITLNGITKKIKFVGGKGTINSNTFNLKKGKTYTVTCAPTNKYHFKVTGKVTIK